MNSVVAEWLRPWEFVSRASCWRGQGDVFGAHSKVKERCLVGGIGGRRARCPAIMYCQALAVEGHRLDVRAKFAPVLPFETILNCWHTDT
jgi:hypothetical protein